MRSIGVLGGAFDPVHLGHIKMAEHALKYVDQVWFQPCLDHMFGKNMSEYGHRVKMLELAIKSYMPFSYRRGKVKVSTYEHDHALKCQASYVILRNMAIDFQHKFMPIIGQDNADKIDKWKFSYDIVREFDFIVFPREYHKKDKPLTWYHEGNHIFAKQDTIPETSSTEIREHLAGWRRQVFLNEKPEDWPDSVWEYESKMCSKYMSERMPTCVLEYIKIHNLYAKT